MRPLRVLVTVDPEIPVPPRHYGGIERVVHMLVSGLVERGHDVFLLAHPDSRVPGALLPYHGRRSQAWRDTVAHAYQVGAAARRLDRLDLVHSFGRLAYLLPLLPRRIPKLQSYQRSVTRRTVRLASRLASGTLDFTACSTSCAATADGAGGRWTVIPNGVPTDHYRFRPSVPPDAPLVFLGRVERIKGAHTAIEVARRTGRRLVIAGNRPPVNGAREYFEHEIEPHLDGDRIQYLGPVTDEQKDELLGRAAALLFPIEWEEPFGIVMAESMACGTPVVAFPRGAVPEVIKDGINGFTCDSLDEMVHAVNRLSMIDRRQCRSYCEEHFSADVVVDRYEELYRSLTRCGGG